jgi:geranylgeranyl diphosphate synthase, type II
LLTLEGAYSALNKQINMAKEYLGKTKMNTDLLLEIIDLVATRDH